MKLKGMKSVQIDGIIENKLIIVLQGGSGSGKSTLANYLSYEKDIPRIITCTTRKKKSWEYEGVDYYFKTLEEFNDMDLIEFTNYGDNLYGTSKDEIGDKLNENDIIVIILEKKGALDLKQSYPENVIIISFPIELEVMRSNLTERKDSKEFIDSRLNNAIALNECDAVDFADYVLTGNSIEEKIRQLNKIIDRRRFNE